MPTRSGGRLALDTLAALLLAALAGVPASAQPEPPQPPDVPRAEQEVAPAEEPAPAEEEAPEEQPARDEIYDEVEREVEERVRETIREEIEDRAQLGEDIREQIQRKLRQARTRSDSKVSFGSSVHIAEDEVGRDVVAIGGNVTIDGDIHGDAVAVGGSVRVNGRVTGDVVAVGGGVRLGPESTVIGEVTSVGGQVEEAEGARVIGRVNEIAFGPSFTWDFDEWDFDGWRWGRPWGAPFRFGQWLGLGWSLTCLVILLLLTSLVQLVAAGTVERVRAKVVESPWISGLVGLVIQLFFIPVLVVVCVILVISIIGIPLLLLIPFLVLALVVASIVGYTGSAMAAGRWAQGRFGWSVAGPFLALLVGVLLIQALHIVGEALEVFPGWLWIFAAMFGLVGFLVRYAAWTVGLGAVFLAGFRSSSGAAELPPPSPSPPPAPGERTGEAEPPPSPPPEASPPVRDEPPPADEPDEPDEPPLRP